MTTPSAREALSRLIELFEIGTDPQWTDERAPTRSDWYQAIHQARQALAPDVAIPGEQYHEDDGPVLWWRFPQAPQARQALGPDVAIPDEQYYVVEPPYSGTPNDCDWPGYHTHFTPLPPAPVAPTPSPKEVP